VTWQDKCNFSKHIKHIKEDESVVLLLAVTYVVFICWFLKMFRPAFLNLCETAAR